MILRTPKMFKVNILFNKNNSKVLFSAVYSIKFNSIIQFIFCIAENNLTQTQTQKFAVYYIIYYNVIKYSYIYIKVTKIKGSIWE